MKPRKAADSGDWIGVDLDGTLAYYDTFVDDVSIGAPIPLMVSHVKQWIEDGYDVRIFTARVCPQPGRDIEPVITAINAWCKEHLGKVLPITHEKDYCMMQLFDDRACQVMRNTGFIVEDVEFLRAHLADVEAKLAILQKNENFPTLELLDAIVEYDDTDCKYPEDDHAAASICIEKIRDIIQRRSKVDGRMSYQQFIVECTQCGKRMNTAFGIVGTTQIATPVNQCPDCGCKKLVNVSNTWTVDNSSVNEKSSMTDSTATPMIELGHCRYMKRLMGWRKVALDDDGQPVGPESEGDETLLNEIIRLRIALEASEMEVRELYWRGHGHSGLYGDDGCMDCCKCIISKFGSGDYRHAPMDEVRGMARMAKLAELTKLDIRDEELSTLLLQERSDNPSGTY